MQGYNLIYLLIFLILSAFIFMIFFKNKDKKNHKPSIIKKEELIKNYEYEMLKLISKYENDKTTLQKKKIEFLKVASNELHNNIFFDEYEAKAIIQKLASY